MKKIRDCGWFIVLVAVVHLAPLMAQTDDPPWISSLEWSDNLAYFAIVTREGLATYDHTYRLLARQAFPDDIGFEMPQIRFSPTGEQLYVGRQTYPTIVNTTQIEAFCAAEWVPSACAQHTILSTETLEQILDFGDIAVSPYTAQWSRDGQSIAFRTEAGRSTVIYSTVDASLLRSYSSPPIGWTLASDGAPEWSPDNLYFAAIGGDKIFIMDAATGQEIAVHQLAGESIRNVIWSPDSPRLGVMTSKEVPPGTVGSYLMPDGSEVRRDTLFIMDALTGEIIAEDYFPWLFQFSWSPDGSQIVIGRRGPTFNILNSETLAVIDTYRASPQPVESYQFSPYSGRIVVAFNLADSLSYPGDPGFVPMTTYGRTEMNGMFEFFAPAASANRLIEVLTACAANSDIVTTGTTFINATQYAELIDWLRQQPATSIPEVCTADLQLIALTVLVEDSAPAPVAYAGVDQTVTDSDDDGTESIHLDGTYSGDNNGTIVAYEWREGGTLIASGVNPTVELAVGVHTLTLTVTDDDGASASDAVVMTVRAPSG